MKENALVQVAVTRQVEGAAEISDNESYTIRAVCNSGGHPEENHDRKAQRGAAARDTIDKTYHCA